MADQIVLRMNKFSRSLSWISLPFFMAFAGLAAIEAIETQVDNTFILWCAVGLMGFVALFIPYLTKKQKIVISENDITVTMLFDGNPVPIDSLEEVRFVSYWGFPKPKKNVLNIGPGFDNKKAALDFLEGKVKVTGAENIK